MKDFLIPGSGNKQCKKTVTHLSGITVFKNFDKFCFLVAFFEIMECLQECCVPHFVGVADEADESDCPEYRPENRAAAGFWKTDFHLDMAFPEICKQIDFLIGTASYQSL